MQEATNDVDYLPYELIALSVKAAAAATTVENVAKMQRSYMSIEDHFCEKYAGKVPKNLHKFVYSASTEAHHW